MTTWGVRQVATWGAQVGWQGSDLDAAVAVAMATSNGADHYRANPSYADELERRGLWGMRALDHDDRPELDLFAPVVNATFAHAVWVQRGRQWAWHPAALSGEADRVLDYVRVALHGAPGRPGSAPVAGFAETLARVVGRIETIRNAVSDGGSVHA